MIMYKKGWDKYRVKVWALPLKKKKKKTHIEILAPLLTQANLRKMTQQARRVFPPSPEDKCFNRTCGIFQSLPL